MILRGGERQRGVAVAQREERGFLALHEFLDHDFRTGFAEPAAEHHVDGFERLIDRRRHHDALARREPVRLHHDRRATLAHVILRGHRVGEMRVSGGGDIIVAAKLFGETLGAFQLSRGLRRPKRLEAGGGQIVDDARRDQRIGPDHHQIDLALAAERDHRRMVGDVQRHAFGVLRDAGIARRAPQLRQQGRCRDLPAQGMFAAAGTKHENIHGIL